MQVYEDTFKDQLSLHYLSSININKISFDLTNRDFVSSVFSKDIKSYPKYKDSAIIMIKYLVEIGTIDASFINSTSLSLCLNQNEDIESLVFLRGKFDFP